MPLLRPARTRWLDVVLAALVAGVLGAIVVVLVRGPSADVRADRAAASRNAAVMAAARQVTLAFLHVDYRAMPPLVAAVLDDSTGAFRRQYAATRAQLEAAAKEARSVSSGTVREVGVSEAGPSSATVFVAADALVRNKQTHDLKATSACPHAGATCRFYRLKLGMARVGGGWKLASLDFVS